MKEKLQQINISTVLIVLLAFILGWQVGHRDVLLQWQNYRPAVSIQDKEPPKNINVDFKLFWDTWDLVSSHHLNKKTIDPTKLFYGAISGMVSAIGDPYTVFLPPDQQKATKEELNGSFEGVGVQIGFNKDKRLVVMAPLPGSPAETAGLKPEDLIIKINGKDTTGITLPDAVSQIRGPKSTQVTLSVYREGEDEPKDYALTRDTIIVKSVELSFSKTQSGKNVAVIKLTKFGERTNQEWSDAVIKIINTNPQAVILDTRNNPGGLLEGAVYIGSEFLDGGDVVLQEDSEGKIQHYQVTRQGKLLDLPMVVLINKGSASASEIVAGALQDRKRAKLVGEKSFGKGTIQEAEDLPGGAGIHITVARWLTPNSRWVNDTNGLTPDVEVKWDRKASDQALPDQQLDKALEVLN